MNLRVLLNNIRTMLSNSNPWLAVLNWSTRLLSATKKKQKSSPLAPPQELSIQVGRQFSSGAYRDTDEGKLDFEGFLSPLVIERFAEYMNKNRLQSNGVLRDSDNWQAGIPKNVYMKSLWRHFFDVWKYHRGGRIKMTMGDSLCALLFNTMGFLHEHLKEKNDLQ